MSFCEEEKGEACFGAETGSGHGMRSLSWILGKCELFVIFHSFCGFISVFSFFRSFDLI